MFRNRKRNQSTVPQAQQQLRGENDPSASFWDLFKKIKMPTPCGDKVCPPGWTCHIEESGTTSCLYTPSAALPGIMPLPVAFQAPVINWEKYWSHSSDDYRILTNMQVFFGGAAGHAGHPPMLQAAVDGVDAVFQFVMNDAMWPPPQGTDEQKADVAAQLAEETGRVMYEQDVVDACLQKLLPKWQAQYAMPLKMKNPQILLPALAKPGRMEARAQTSAAAGGTSIGSVNLRTGPSAAMTPVSYGVVGIVAPPFPTELVPYEAWAVQEIGNGNPTTLFTSHALGNAAFNNLYGPTLLAAGIVDGKIPAQNAAAGGWDTGWQPWVQTWWRMVERAAEWLGAHPQQAQPQGPQPLP